ncbi:GTP pyrophosphokinase family protein [Paeniglutamicibacter sp. ORCA_105]|uniref:GTP pyrophosphokinase family protein n=1 Tax=Paeniglutamicibacter sp. ORCA_105 TaxID=3377336 RepID=UPI003893B3DB
MGTPWETLDDSLRDQVRGSVERYAAARPMLEHVAEAMRTRIESLFDETENTPLFVVSRVKTVESFRDKASRMLVGEEGETPALEFPSPLREIHDLVGVRVIVKLPHEIREAANLIKRRRSDFDCRSDREKDIGSVESGTYGYSSRHLILKTRGEEVVRDFQAKLGGDTKITGNFVFEVQIRTILSHAWSEIEHDIRFKNAEPRAWSPHIDRQFTATAAMLEAVEDQFSELHERFETVTGFWDAEGEGAVPLAAGRIQFIWQTLLPHVDRKSDDDWGWAAELLAAHGLSRTREFAALLQPNVITSVRAALDHRYSPGPDRLLDDVLLWHFGTTHIEATSGGDAHRADSLRRRLVQMDAYRIKQAQNTAVPAPAAGLLASAARPALDESQAEAKADSKPESKAAPRSGGAKADQQPAKGNAKS